MDRWTPLVGWPEGLFLPAVVDASRKAGPTRAQSRGRSWLRTSAGRFVPADIDRTVVEQRILEQSVQVPPGGAVTGWAALRLRGARYLDGLAADGSTPLPVPLALPRAGNMRPSPERQVLRGRLDAAEVELAHGVRCTTAVRAVFDEVRRLDDLREAVVVLDMALVACLVTRAEVEELVTRMAGRPGVALLRQALGLASTRSCSPQETRLRLVWVLDAQLPEPLCNWPISDEHGSFLGKPDLLCAELGTYGEYDGKDHRSRQRHRTDVGRAESFLAAGLEGFTVVGGDLQDRGLVVRRMHDAVERARASTRPRRWMIKSGPRPLWP